MTDADRKRLRELAASATPGPWVAANGKGSAVVRTEHPEHDCAIYLNVRTCETDCCVDRWQADARFIAAADPDAVIALLDEISRWKGAAQGLRDNIVIAEQHLANRGEDILRLQQQITTLTTERDALRGQVQRLKDAANAEDNLLLDTLAECENSRDALKQQLASAKADAERMRGVYEAAKTWCETVYIGKPHPRFPAYPGDELLLAVNAVKFADSTLTKKAGRDGE